MVAYEKSTEMKDITYPVKHAIGREIGSDEPATRTENHVMSQRAQQGYERSAQLYRSLKKPIRHHFLGATGQHALQLPSAPIAPIGKVAEARKCRSDRHPGAESCGDSHAESPGCAGDRSYPTRLPSAEPVLGCRPPAFGCPSSTRHRDFVRTQARVNFHQTMSPSQHTVC
jgi:hypothetical protein